MFWGKLLTSHGTADTPNHRGGRRVGMQAKSCGFSLLMGRKAERAEGMRGGHGACWCCSVVSPGLSRGRPRGSPPGSGHSEGPQGCHSRATCSLAPCHRSHRALHGNRQAATCHEGAPGEQRNPAACTWMGLLVLTWASLATATLGSVLKQQRGLDHNPFLGCCYPKPCCHD